MSKQKKRRLLFMAIIFMLGSGLGIGVYIANKARMANVIINPKSIALALQANCSNPAALRGLALNDLLAHRYKEAISAYKLELKVEPTDKSSEFIEGVTYERLKDYQSALHIYADLSNGTGTIANEARSRINKILILEKMSHNE